MSHVGGGALGVAHAGGRTVLVSGAAAGDRVRIRLNHLSPHRPLAWARVVEVERRGAEFRSPPCPQAAPVRGRCGGCAAMHLTEAARLAALSRHLEETLAPLAFPEPPAVQPSPLSEGYRSRANYIVHRVAPRPPDRGGGEGRVILGSWAPRSHDVAAMDGCRVVRPPIDRVARQLAEVIGRLRVPIHPPAALESGALRYVTIRAGQAGEALVDLVVSAAEPPWLEGLLDETAALPGVVGVAVSVNASSGNALRVAPSETRRGWETVVETVGEGELAVALQVSAASFTQLNTAVAGRMYRRAAEWVAQRKPPAAVWDLYCGVGALGLTVLRALGRSGAAPALCGAESQAFSVGLARTTARANGLSASFEAVDLDRVDLGRQPPAGWPAPQAVLLNPPRRGLHPPVLDFLTGPAAAGVGRLAYMSCNPVSFVRDARRLARAGYRLAHLEAHDMLPGTAHVEMLAGFERGAFS